MLKIEVIGNIGADAERKNANGSEFIAFRMANTQKFRQQDGTEKEVTDWIDVTMSNVDSNVVPYLKRGEKIFVRGTGKLRVYSSPKDRCMKAGLTVMAQEIELVGGIRDAVPRELVVPDSGALVKVNKFYQAEVDTSKWEKDDQGFLYDRQGKPYALVKGGWVSPYETTEEQNQDQAQEEKK